MYVIPHVRILRAESHVNFASLALSPSFAFFDNRGERNNIWTCPPNGRLRFVLAATGASSQFLGRGGRYTLVYVRSGTTQPPNIAGPEDKLTKN
ncbi:MAG: hypothetical protein ACTS44_01455 [Candidatus Hodgkinia cicadicola]